MSTSHESGIYLIRNKRTGDAYVGATCHLTTRLTSHRTKIRNRQGKDGYTPPFDGVFVGCKEKDIELRILERVEVPASENPKHAARKDPSPGIARLLEREAHWIKTLKPTLNVKGNRKIEIDALPVGAP